MKMMGIVGLIQILNLENNNILGSSLQIKSVDTGIHSELQLYSRKIYATCENRGDPLNKAPNMNFLTGK